MIKAEKPFEGEIDDSGQDMKGLHGSDRLS